MLTVMTPPTAQDRPLLGRRLELCFFNDSADCRAVFLLEGAGVRRDTAIDGGLQGFVDLE